MLEAGCLTQPALSLAGCSLARLIARSRPIARWRCVSSAACARFLLPSPLWKQSHWIIETLDFPGDSLRMVASKMSNDNSVGIKPEQSQKKKGGAGKGEEGRDGKKRDAKECRCV